MDDLGVTDESSAPALSMQILAHLRSAKAPVAIFVNCQKLRDDTLELWRAAGATIGNHTNAHLSLDDGDGPGVSSAWWNGVESCAERLTRALGQPVRYFRFPFLRYGSTEARKRDAAERLRTLNYQVAHVTAATSEWLLAAYYDVATASSDAALARDLAARYVEHMVESLAAAERLSVGKTGRDVRQITLLHVNRLAADHLGEVLAALEERKWRFISLSDALADPVYALPDSYVGGCSCSWLARIDPPLKPDDEYVFGDYETRLRAEFEGRVAALQNQ